MVNPAQPEATDGSELVLGRDVEHLVDKVWAPEPFVELGEVISLCSNLLAGLQLIDVLLFVVVQAPPDFILLPFDILLFVRQNLDLILNLFLILIHFLKFTV